MVLNKYVIAIILAVAISIPLMSQPGSAGGFTLHRDLVYIKHGNLSLQLDLYTPGGTAMAGGIGVVGKEPKVTTTRQSDEKPPDPVLLWLPVPGTDKFPTPVASFVGNGYAVVSMEVESNSTCLAKLFTGCMVVTATPVRAAGCVEQMDAAMESGDMPQTIVVFVQGLPIGWYNNSKDGTMPVEDVIIKDLIPYIDATYRTISKREARGIEGTSMGGYGSLHLGFKYPGLFGVVSSIAPSITTFEMERKEVIVPTFEDDTAYFNANSPSTLVQKNPNYIRANTTIMLLVGDKDFLYELIQEFHQQLQDLRINHEYAVAKDADHDYKEVINKLDFNSFAFWDNAFKSYK